jgi:hypothetical protein
MRQKGPVEEVELAGDEEQHNAPFSLARLYDPAVAVKGPLSPNFARS